MAAPGGGDDVISGNEDNDILYGGLGKDTLLGGSGNDRVKGGPGNDRISGGPGNDHLTGGPGSDTFIFNRDNGNDTIFDFTPGTDRIDLTAFDIEDDYQLSFEREAGGILLDLNDISGGTVLLAGLTEMPDSNDFIV